MASANRGVMWVAAMEFWQGRKSMSYVEFENVTSNCLIQVYDFSSKTLMTTHKGVRED
jgi:hypothetical protein